MSETKSKRGFASMDPERRREIARKGGASVKAANRSFAKKPGLAASAGRKGGEAGGQRKGRKAK
jgi:general stress protein YciG